MITQRKIFWGSLVCAFLNLSGCSEDIESFYHDKAAVLEDRAIEYGWIPDILPDSATQISETHDLDTNTGVGEFVFHERDERWPRERLEIRLVSQIRQHVLKRYNLPDTHEVFIWGNFIVSVDWEKHVVVFILPYTTTMQELRAQVRKKPAIGGQ